MLDKNTSQPPPRVAARPDPARWGDDEMLNLPEAAALFWPGGPLNVRSLRTAVRDGQLPIVRIAGKILTTPRSIREMARTAAPAPVPKKPRPPRPPSPPREAGPRKSDQPSAAKATAAARAAAEATLLARLAPGRRRF